MLFEGLFQVYQILFRDSSPSGPVGPIGHMRILGLIKLIFSRIHFLHRLFSYLLGLISCLSNEFTLEFGLHKDLA